MLRDHLAIGDALLLIGLNDKPGLLTRILDVLLKWHPIAAAVFDRVACLVGLPIRRHFAPDWIIHARGRDHSALRLLCHLLGCSRTPGSLVDHSLKQCLSFRQLLDAVGEQTIARNHATG